MNRDEINEFLSDFDDERLLLADGLEEAFIGRVEQFNKPLACYDYRKCVEVFMRQGMTHEEAEEWMSYNVLGAWAGEKTPAFLFRPEEPEPGWML